MEVDNEKQLEGIGGWLVLYIVLGFMGVLKLVFSVVVFGFPIVFRLPAFFYMALGVWNAVVCFQLLRRYSIALKMVFLVLLAKMMLVALHSLVTLVSFWAALFSGENYYPAIIDIARATGSFLMPWLWYLYFRRSQRVKATFTETFSFASNKRNTKLINVVGIFTVAISLLASVYAVMIENQAKPFLYEAMKEQGISILNRRDIQKVATAKKNAFQKLWESRR